MTSINPDPKTQIPISSEHISQLESQGCTATDWRHVTTESEFDYSRVRNVAFTGPAFLGRGATVMNVPGGIANCRVGRDAYINNVASISFEPEAPCGCGIEISCLDETGTRPVVAYPGLSCQLAVLMARTPQWLENRIRPGLHDFIDSRLVPHEIGDKAIVRDCGELINVYVGSGASVIGASRLANGSIINTSQAERPLAFVGAGVNAENFIIEDGTVDSGAIIRNCYIGQGARLERGFSAHDSLFFANCSFENGEACAVLAGPYSVSMHRSSLLIGIQTSFMNAGSASNQSNHLYKLGPVHCGVLERGVKTSSGSYIMLGAKIGAFSLVMGQHKTHPDSSEFPFSYLFGDERGATVVVPAAMLRSCGMLRDETKWPTRDRRLKRKLDNHDRIIFSVLTPYTVDSMLRAIDIISKLLLESTYDDLYLRYKGMKFTRAALERAKILYTFAIYKYLSLKLPDYIFPAPTGRTPEKWLDLGGQIIRRSTLDRILEYDSIEEAEKMLDEEMTDYDKNEIEWIASRFDRAWRDRAEMIKPGAQQFDTFIDDDRKEYLANLSRENKMLSL